MYSRERASRARVTEKSMEEDDVAKSRVGQYPHTRRTDKERKGYKLEEFIRRCQGLAEG